VSVQKRIWKRNDGTTGVAWWVRWQEGERWRSATFARKKDADALDTEIRRRRRLGTLALLDAGTETLDEYTSQVWAPAYASQLQPKTQAVYAAVYDRHVSPTLGTVELRAITPAIVTQLQADRLRAGAGPPVVRKAIVVLGAILQTAAESGRIASNPVRLAKKRKLPERPEIVPLAPVTIEKLRARASPRDAVLLSVLAYAGLRPGEALALRWADVRERTILVERALALGGVKGTKTGRSRTVRLLSPLAADLRQWRMRCGRPSDHELVFPGHDGKPWSESAYQSWRRRAFKRALTAAGIEHARPYDLRHSFASLLIQEGRSVVDVARQLGHSATMTLRVYGHVLDEFADAPQQNAEGAILVARESSAAHRLHIAPGNGP
jgi:integrase